MKKLAKRLKAMSRVCALVQHFIEEHVPEKTTTEPVLLPRVVFDGLCLAALVGLEAIDPETPDEPDDDSSTPPSQEPYKHPLADDYEAGHKRGLALMRDGTWQGNEVLNILKDEARQAKDDPASSPYKIGYADGVIKGVEEKVAERDTERKAIAKHGGG